MIDNKNNKKEEDSLLNDRIKEKNQYRAKKEKKRKRNRNIAIILALLILTNGLTFIFSRYSPFSNSQYVKLTKEEFNNYKKISKVKQMLDKSFLREIDEDKYIDGQIKGLVASLDDPYTRYMSEEEFTSLQEQTEGSFGGIGVIVTPGDDNLITVVSAVEDTPGEKAGIQAEDKIIEVEGKEYLGDEMSDAVKVMKGEPGTDVDITIMRKKSTGENEFIELTLTREIIRVDSVKSDIIDNNIGYMRMTSFDKETHNEFREAIKNFEDNNVEGFILDLRNNPGGLLDVCAKIADDLLEDGLIVYTEDKSGNREELKSKKGSYKKPLVVITNNGSASASEILAGAIKDHNRGEIVGTTTFGKGLVQRIYDLNDGSGINITISEFFTPNGNEINKVGVEPNHIVELNEDIEGIGLEYLQDDNQLQKALEVLKNKID